MNTIKRKPKNSHNYPDAFVDKGNFITDKNEMVNRFNEYFVIVGIELANNIAPTNQHVSVHDYLLTKNKSSIFLDPVLEQDIIATVNSCKSKTSCYFNGIDMKVVKKGCIVRISPNLYLIFATNHLHKAYSQTT